MPYTISNFKVSLDELVGKPLADERSSKDQFRQICFKSGVFDGKRGSAYVEFGETKVLSQINGPREYSDGDYHSCSVKVVIKGFTNDKIRAQIESAMSGCIQLNKYAKSEIEIEISVIKCAEGVLQAAIVSSCLALIHAGIELWDIVVAAHVIVNEDETFTLDPSIIPPKSKASVTVGLMPQRNQIVCTDIRGALTSRIVNEVIRFATLKANLLCPVVRSAILSSLQ